MKKGSEIFSTNEYKYQVWIRNGGLKRPVVGITNMYNHIISSVLHKSSYIPQSASDVIESPPLIYSNITFRTVRRINKLNRQVIEVFRFSRNLIHKRRLSDWIHNKIWHCVHTRNIVPRLNDDMEYKLFMVLFREHHDLQVLLHEIKTSG